MLSEKPMVNAIAPWYGGNRLLASEVGAELQGCDWVGVPFMGGGSELLTIKARTIVANDLHRLVMNLALVMCDRVLGPALYRRLRRWPFHADTLEMAQRITTLLQNSEPKEMAPEDNMALAEAYFVTCWMGRSANAGTKGEFRGKLPVRWNANGGDSAKRYASATASIPALRRWLRYCNFVSMDAFDFLDQCQDKPAHGIYVDAPWPDAGQKYRFAFAEQQQRELAERLGTFKKARVVVRYGDHQLIRQLYPADRWTWRTLAGRKQSNAESSEVMIINGPSYATEG